MQEQTLNDDSDHDRRGALERQPANLAAITGDAPAAVLLVDLAARAVVHVNPVARQLAAGAELPIGIDAWSDAAQLRDLDGAELSDTDHPLSKVARSEPVAGQAVSAASSSDLGRRREPLWVVALPMLDAPMLTDHALVVLLPLREQDAAQAARTAAEEQAQLRDRAVVATGLSFTVADARSPDMPLVWVNPAFTATTGYDFDDAVGHNCRFLQGPGTDPDAPKIMRSGLEAGESVTVTLLNYRKDGLAFWNQVAMSPIFGAGGELTHFVGIQTDVSGRVAADEARDAALEAERAAREQADAARTQADAARQVADRAREQAETARRQAEAAQSQAERARAAAERSRAEAENARASAEQHRSRLALLALATERLSGTLEVAECRQRLLELVVPQLGDWAAVLTTGGGGQVTEVTSEHRDPGQTGVLRSFLDQLRHTQLSSPLHDLLLNGLPARRLPDLADVTARLEHLDGDRDELGDEHGDEDGDCRPDSAVRDLTRTLADALGVGSVLMVPLPGREPSGDMLILARGRGSRPHTDDDLDIAVDLARRAGLILDNARLFEAQHRIASTLQASLLPDLPRVAGVEIAARYHAAEANADVGGDFYEVIDLPGEGFAFAIGDVVGHDVYATAAMGHLKGLLRACAWDATLQTPADVLRRVDELIAALGMSTMATLTYGHLAREETGWLLTYSSAGHPPLLVREPDGTVQTLDAVGGIPLGILPGHPRDNNAVPIAEGSIVLAYTDGLVERRHEVLTVGLHRLADSVRRAPHDPGQLCQHLLDELATGGAAATATDDVALLALLLQGADEQS